MLVAFAVLTSFVIFSCAGNQSKTSEITDETIEVVEVKTCCKVDTVGTCEQSNCDTTKTCKSEQDACVKSSACSKSINCATKE